MQEEPDVRAPCPRPSGPWWCAPLAKDPARRYPNCLAFIRALHIARSAARPEPVVAAPAGDNRPRSISDTMEDIFLEQVEVSDDCVDLGGPPRSDEDEVSKLGITIAQPPDWCSAPYAGPGCRHSRPARSA